MSTDTERVVSPDPEQLMSRLLGYGLMNTNAAASQSQDVPDTVGQPTLLAIHIKSKLYHGFYDEPMQDGTTWSTDQFVTQLTTTRSHGLRLRQFGR